MLKLSSQTSLLVRLRHAWPCFLASPWRWSGECILTSNTHASTQRSMRCPPVMCSLLRDVFVVLAGVAWSAAPATGARRIVNQPAVDRRCAGGIVTHRSDLEFRHLDDDYDDYDG